MRPQDFISPEDTLAQVSVHMPRQPPPRPSQQGDFGTTVLDSSGFFLRHPVSVTWSPKYEQHLPVSRGSQSQLSMQDAPSTWPVPPGTRCPGFMAQQGSSVQDIRAEESA